MGEPFSPERATERPTLPLTVIVVTWQRPESVRRLLLNLAEHDHRPAEILIIEGHESARGDCAEPDCAVCSLPLKNRPRHYYAVPNLEQQRNVGADLVTTPLVCFLDDDVVLEPGCLARITEVFERDTEGKIGGVGGFELDNPLAGQVPWRWRVRRLLGVVPTLTPGRYTRSGNSIPLEMSSEFSGTRRVDFLTGYCMAYRSHVLQETRFVPDVGLGEDLHYSLRVAHHYELYHCGDARLHHYRERAGRPNHRRYAFMYVYNRYCYQRDCLLNRNGWDVCLLWYGVAVDLALLLAQWFASRDRRAVTDHVIGRLHAIRALATRGADRVAVDAARAAFPRRSSKEY